MIDMIEKEDPVITEEEAAQYDRQIRLWGLDAQKRLRGSRVLLVGLGGLGAEVAKNLILAGVKGLTMLDHEKASEELCRAQFLVPVSKYGQSRAQASVERAQTLNPMVEVRAQIGLIEDMPESFFLPFSAVCLTGCSRAVMVRVDHICAEHNIMLFSGDIHGYYGYMFCNLGPEHSYVEEKPKVVKPSGDSNDGPEAKRVKLDPNETTMVKKTAKFCMLKEALQVDWTTEKAKAGLKKRPVDYFLLHVLLKFRAEKHRAPEPKSFAEDSQLLRQIRDDLLEAMGVGANILSDDFISYCFSVMPPVCAVVGGVLGQEIVKALSQRDAPHRNFFFFDGRKGNGMVDYFGPN
ncbi:SUMO-activating enzyme subunit 1 [Nerophis lumbriciformis]|uniref:SUMO-activating enzyme subunit 1 n=1 Tax=Nerophis lumbriciformis TaxID=546530 RepID=UPI002ADF9668|nr:SUMO-activating enzyme subunit 1-like [Nerophis lumbriciformis]